MGFWVRWRSGFEEFLGESNPVEVRSQKAALESAVALLLRVAPLESAVALPLRVALLGELALVAVLV